MKILYTTLQKENGLRRAAPAIAALVFLACPAFCQGGVLLAAQKDKARAPAVHAPAAALEAVGKVDGVTLEDPAKGTRSEISIIDGFGTRLSLIVKPTTTIYGDDWKAISLDKLPRDRPVRVQYARGKDGSFTALSIKPSLNP